MTTKFLTIKFAKFLQILLSWNFSGKTAFWTPIHDMSFGQDFYQTYARTRVERGFFVCPFFAPKHRKISRKCPEMAPFLFCAKARLKAQLWWYSLLNVMTGKRIPKTTHPNKLGSAKWERLKGRNGSLSKIFADVHPNYLRHSLPRPSVKCQFGQSSAGSDVPKGPKIETYKSRLIKSISIEKWISLEIFNLDLQNSPQK